MTETTVPRPIAFAALVQQFFTEYLVTQRALSPRTIASYRDAMLLFLDFAQHRLNKMPTALSLSDITPDLILAFLIIWSNNATIQYAQPEFEADSIARIFEIRSPTRCIFLFRH